MVAPIKVEAFGGMAPAIDSSLLSPNAADYAVNAWLDLGTLTGFYSLKTIATATMSQVGKAYRIPLDYGDPDVFGNSKYLFFENPDTDVIRGATFGDIYDRYYWASSSNPPQYNTLARIIADDPPWLLGIPTPPTAPSLLITGGVGTPVSRAYLVTFVSEYGEEGAPSPPVSGNGPPDGTWALSSIPVPAPNDMGVNRNITAKRIYRTITSSTGIATYFMVTELLPTVTTYDDTVDDADITGNAQLDIGTPYTPPPADLEGFCMGQNGILAGWRGNEVWFSVPYRPHAWPSTYVLMVEYPIVGIASIFQTFYVLTHGYPVTITGTTPLSLIPGRVSVFEPCTSRGGIVTFPEGVYYPSGNGLILLQSGAAINVTKGLITKERWQTYVQSARFRAGRLGSAYYGFGTVQFGSFQQDTFDNDAFAMEDYSGQYNGVLIDPSNPRLGLMLLRSDAAVNNVQNDVWSSELSIIKGNTVYWLDLSDTSQIVEPYEWHSKEFSMQWPCSLAAAKIFFDIPPTTPLQNPVRDTSQDQVLKPDQYGIITWYGDGRQIAQHEIRKTGELFRLPSDRKYDDFSFTIHGRVEIKSVHVASTSKDLRAI